MEQKDKELLLKDLSARLPYRVRGKVEADTVVPHKYDIDGFPVETTFDVDVELQRIDISADEIFVSTFDNNEALGNYIEESQIEGAPWNIEEFTPYLRLMSSITKEEKEEVKPLFSKFTDEFGETRLVVRQNKMASYQDWLNAHHFDYRGLIDKGLAIAVTEENNPYENSN
jgi:hypothetical protein